MSTSTDLNSNERNDENLVADSPRGKNYICPSNTIVASDGEIYQFEPFQLPPPSEIAEVFRELKDRREREASIIDISQKKSKSSDIFERNQITQRRRNNDDIRYSSPYKGSPALPPEWIKSIKKDSHFQPDDIEDKTDDTEKEKSKEMDLSIFKYLYIEIFGGFGSSNTSSKEQNAVKNINNFLVVPIGLEKLIWFGFFACLDTFLFTFTVLPIRVLISLIYLTIKFIHKMSKDKFQIPPSLILHRTNVIDLIRAILVVISCYLLQLLNMSRVYHYIRGQTTVKLYVLTGMLEVFDKLLSSFGIDAFDSLYWKIRNTPEWDKILISFSIVALYVILHSCLYFSQIATLTVATNSTDQAMITVMILNNFTEIKSSVFKKFDKNNLFQLACSDVTERFQLCLFMLIIVLVGVAQTGESYTELFPAFIKIILTMVSCEAFADWIKHSFIVKINMLEPSLYDDYSRVLRSDVLNRQKDNAVLERAYSISRRLGFPQIPLACVTVRYVNLFLSTPVCSNYLNSFNFTQICSLAFIIYILLLIMKVFVGIGLVYYANYIQNEEANSQIKSEVKDTKKVDSLPLNTESKESFLRLSDIERYSTWKGRIIG